MPKPHIQQLKEQARQTLADSIAFRTSVIDLIHQEIYDDIWRGQQEESAQRILSARPLPVHRLSFD